MADSIVYRHPLLYELAIAALYRRHYLDRYRAVAETIPPGARVVDVCCGPGALYTRFLRERSVEYTGLDANPVFVDHLRTHGVDAERWDLREPQPLPQADYVTMLGSLYQFPAEAEAIVDRLLSAAREAVVISEPVRNLAASSNRFMAILGRRLTKTRSGEHEFRFTEEGLDRLLEPHRSRIERSFAIPGGRDKVYVLRGSGAG